MKKWFMILLGCILLLCGCGRNGQKLILAKDGETEYKLVNYLSDSDAVRSLTTMLVAKTGATFTEDTGEKAIYIGLIADFADVSNVNLVESYANYQIAVQNDNIYIVVSSEEAAKEAVEELKKNIEKLSDNTFGVSKDMNIVKNVGGSSEPIPVFVTGSGNMLGDLYDCGSNNNYEVIYQNVDAANAPGEIEAYKTKVVEAGYELHSENSIGENRFATYVKGDTMLHCNYFPAIGQFRIVYGLAGDLPKNEPVECKKVVEPSMSLIQMPNALCMVYQGTDGSFVIMDGSYGTDAEISVVINQGTAAERPLTYKRDTSQSMEKLWNFLVENTPDGGRPQVTWMITHADPDHIGLPTKFIAEYAGQFDLNVVCYNFPNTQIIGLTYGEGPDIYAAYADSFVSTVKDKYPDAVHYVYHTGDKLYIPGGEIEFLFTHEDLAPNPMASMNHTSSVWRFTVEGTTVLITGDAEKELCNQMVACYGEILKSDALQCNHHGSNAATLDFYKLVDPTVCFWACNPDYFNYDQRHLGIKPGYEFNQFLRQSAKVKAHYTCDETHTVLLPSLEER